MYNNRNEQGFATLVGFLLTAIILCILFYLSFTTYFKGPKIDTAVEETMKQQGVDTSEYTTVLEGMKGKIKEIEQQQIRDGENLVDRYQGMIEEGR